MEGACKLHNTSPDVKAKQDIADKASIDEEGTPRLFTLEEREQAKQRIESLYTYIEQFLQLDEYTQDLRDELHKSYPSYFEVLKKRKIDVRKEQGIVIAGETSSGKSTLLNKIYGKNIFPQKIYESTSTVCKIRNSEKIRIKIENEQGNIEDVTKDEFDLSTKSGVEKFKTKIAELTNIRSSPTSIRFRSVEIELPFPFLKDDTILVDTPGIGGSHVVTKKLMEYIPNAASFIFVLDVNNSTGMQEDRLPEILKSITMRHRMNEMPSFDPEDVIFLSNKWDVISTDPTIQDEKGDLWKSTKLVIKQRWPAAKEENIFRMSLKHVRFKLKPKARTFSTKEFEKFKNVLKSTVEKVQNIRIVKHFMFIQAFLQKVSRGIHARIELKRRSEIEQRELSQDHEKEIAFLSDKCYKEGLALTKKIDDTMRQVAANCYSYMSTAEGKDMILNPPNRIPIMKEIWTPKGFDQEIESRVALHVKKYLQSTDVRQKFEEISKEINDLYKTVSESLSEMENVWTNAPTDLLQSLTCSQQATLKEKKHLPPLINVAFATTPLWVPLLVASAGISFVLSPIILPAFFYLNRDERKKKEADQKYEICKDSIRSHIYNNLKSNYGDFAIEIVKQMSDELLPKRIKSFETMIHQLSISRAEILSNQESLVKLASHLETIEESAKDFQEYLKMKNILL